MSLMEMIISGFMPCCQASWSLERGDRGWKIVVRGSCYNSVAVVLLLGAAWLERLCRKRAAPRFQTLEHVMRRKHHP